MLHLLYGTASKQADTAKQFSHPALPGILLLLLILTAYRLFVHCIVILYWTDLVSL